METIVKDLVEKLLAMQSQLTEARVSHDHIKGSLARAMAENASLKDQVEELEDKLKTKTNTVIFQYDKCRELEKKIEELETKLKENEAPAEAEDGKV